MLIDLLFELSSARGGILGTLRFCAGLARNSYLLSTFLRLKMPFDFVSAFCASLDLAGSSEELFRLF
jgi:hypothetical protein